MMWINGGRIDVRAAKKIQKGVCGSVHEICHHGYTIMKHIENIVTRYQVAV